MKSGLHPGYLKVSRTYWSYDSSSFFTVAMMIHNWLEILFCPHETYFRGYQLIYNSNLDVFCRHDYCMSVRPLRYIWKRWLLHLYYKHYHFTLGRRGIDRRMAARASGSCNTYLWFRCDNTKSGRRVMSFEHSNIKVLQCHCWNNYFQDMFRHD